MQTLASVGEPEHLPLRIPGDRQIGCGQQRLPGERSGLVSIDDSGDDIWCEVCEPDQPREVLAGLYAGCSDRVEIGIARLHKLIPRCARFSHQRDQLFVAIGSGILTADDQSDTLAAGHE